jgi:hypothetical protein
MVFVPIWLVVLCSERAHRACASQAPPDNTTTTSLGSNWPSLSSESIPKDMLRFPACTTWKCWVGASQCRYIDKTYISSSRVNLSASALSITSIFCLIFASVFTPLTTSALGLGRGSSSCGARECRCGFWRTGRQEECADEGARGVCEALSIV